MSASRRVGDRTIVERNYDTPFMLDKEKLTRIVSILDEAYGDTEYVIAPIFRVELRDNRVIEPVSFEELVRLDNTARNPIVTLTIIRQTSNIRTYLTYRQGRFRNINLEVASPDTKLAHGLFAELEEQLERTLLRGWIYRNLWGSSYVFLLLSTLFLLSSGFFYYTLGTISSNSQSGSRNDLSKEEIATLLEKAQVAVTVEERINFLFEVQRAELIRQQAAVESRSTTFNLTRYANLTTLLIALPWLIAIGCTLYNLRYCYPRNVFVWGDYAEEYRSLLARRKTLWNVVMGVIILGVVTNVSVTALARYLP